MATATVTAAGLTDMRQHVETTWGYIEVRSDTQAPLFRLPVADARVNWVDDYVSNPLTIEVVLTGSDSDVGVGMKVQGAALFNVASAGSSLVDVTYDAPFEFQNTEDQLTLRITVQIPAI